MKFCQQFFTLEIGHHYFGVQKPKTSRSKKHKSVPHLLVGNVYVCLFFLLVPRMAWATARDIKARRNEMSKTKRAFLAIKN